MDFSLDAILRLVTSQAVSDRESDSSAEEEEEEEEEGYTDDSNAEKVPQTSHSIFNDDFFGFSEMLNDIYVTNTRSLCSSCTELSCLLADIACKNNIDVKITEEDLHDKGHSEYGSLFSALHAACMLNNIELVKLLVEKGADVNAQTDCSSYSPMHVLLNQDEVDTNIVNYLIVHGADLNHKDYSDQTPLHVAAKKSHVSSVASFIKHSCNLNILDSSKYTPLMIAASAESLDIVQMLLANGADPNILSSNDWQDCLTQSDNSLAVHCKVKNVEIFKLLLEKTDFQLLNDPARMKELLRTIFIQKATNSLDILLKTNYRKDFPFESVMFGKYRNFCLIGQLFKEKSFLPFKDWKKMLDIMLKNGLSVNINSTDCMPPLSFATYTAPIQSAPSLCNQRRHIAKLIRCGADVNYPDAAAPEALIFSCWNKKASIMLLLFQKSDFATPDSVLNAYIEVHEVSKIVPEVIQLFLKLGMTQSSINLLNTYPVEHIPGYSDLTGNVYSLKQLSRTAVRHMFYSEWSNLSIDDIMKNLNLPSDIRKYLRYLKLGPSKP